MHRTLILAALTLTARPLTAQMPAPLDKAAETITEQDLAHRIGLLAHDSMAGRDTPSRGLELTAQYVANQFQQFGLKPTGDRGTWFQRYPISKRRLDLAHSRVVFTAGGQEAAAGFTTAALWAGGAVPAAPLSGRAVWVAGPHTAASAATVEVHGKVVLYRAPATVDMTTRQQVLQALLRNRPAGLVVLSAQDSVTFAARVPPRAPERAVLATESPATEPPVVVVPAHAVQRVLAAAGVDLAQAAAATTPVARDIAGLAVRLEMKDEVLATDTVPNVVALLEGTDPQLKNEYVVLSAHMDHVGLTPGPVPPGAESIYNGADDNASGTAGLLELAEAFSQPGARPRRSIIFLAVSGEEKGLWGSHYFTDHPPVPLKQLVANINLDMIGRKWADTIWVVGKPHSDLGATLDRVAAAHPELGMTPIDDPRPTALFSSDHYSFAHKGVPVLKFGNGPHEDYHQPSDAPEKINAEKAARLVRLVFHLGHAVGNADQRPRWNPESYQQIVQQP